MTGPAGPVVVDIGCADHGEWFSLAALADEYKPKMIYGFDPSADLDTSVTKINGVPCVLERKAAWTYDGTIAFTDAYIGVRVGEPIGVGPAVAAGDPTPGRIGVIGEGDTQAECFDFAAWLKKHGPAVVKMDCEGAEYDLLDHLADAGVGHLVTELVIEWHDHREDEDHTVPLACPVRYWWM